MSTDGRVWSGTMPMTGAHFDASLVGRMYVGTTFPDGSVAGNWMMSIDHAAGQLSGQFSGAGDAGHVSLMTGAMWNRPASLQTLAGVYTRSTWNGYSMTMAIGSDGQWMGSMRGGCRISSDRDQSISWIGTT